MMRSPFQLRTHLKPPARPSVPSRPTRWITRPLSGFLLASAIAPLLPSAARAQAVEDDVVINEFAANRSATQGREFVELLVVKPGGVDMRGWTISDNSSRTAAANTTEGDATLPSGAGADYLSAVPQGTHVVIVLTQPQTQPNIIPEDLSNSDDNTKLVLIAGTTPGLVASVSTPLDISTNDNIQLYAGSRATGTLIDQVLAGSNQQLIAGAQWGDNSAATTLDNIDGDNNPATTQPAAGTVPISSSALTTGAVVRFVPAADSVAEFRNNDTGSKYVVDAATFGTPGAANVGVTENSLQAAPGRLLFSAPAFSVNEDGGTATISVTRVGGVGGAVSVRYTTSNGTATAGQDYTAASDILSFADGEGGTKTFSVAILNDSTPSENTETLNLTLSDPTGGATVGTPGTAVLSIVDDDQPGTFQLEAASVNAAEGATAIFAVARTNGSSGAISIPFTLSGGTAVAGQDFPAALASGTLNFASGQSRATIEVPLTDDAVIGDNETATLQLGQPSNGGSLGAQTSSALTIIETDRAPLLLINEVKAEDLGADEPYEFIEVRGTPNALLTNIFVLLVNGPATSAGTVGRAYDLSGQRIGSNGLLIIKSTVASYTNIPAETTIFGTTTLDVTGGLSNGAASFVLALFPPGTVAQNTDLDANNDGVLELPANAMVIDAIGYKNGGAGDLVYGPEVRTAGPATLGTGLSATGEPPDEALEAITRFPNDTTALSSAAFYGGTLTGTGATTNTYDSAQANNVTANFPTGGVVTPGAPNAPTPPDNTPPDAVDDAFTIDEDAPAQALQVLANDTDADANSVRTVTAVTQGTKGAVAIGANGANVTYAPAANANGTDTFTYTISDGQGGSDTATVTITLTPIDDAPTLNAIANQAVAEDSGAQTVALGGIGPGGASDEAAQTITLTATSSDPSIIAAPTISGTGSDRTLSFTPAPNASGTATITVTATDSGSGTAPNANTSTRTFTITVTPVNDAPDAVDDAFTLPEDAPARTLQVLANDSDADAGDAFTVTSITQGSKGTVAIGANGASLTYTPAADANGTDSFTYTISDGALTDTATVTISITPVNDAPQAQPDAATVAEDSGASTLQVLANDTDADAGDVLRVTSVTQGTKGTVAVGPNGGGVVYTPAADANGTDSFTYTISDGAAFSTATVTVTITPVNDAPTGTADPFTIDNNSVLSVTAPGVLRNDSDPEGDTLSAALVSGSGPAHGALAFNPNGSFSYDPEDTFVGSDTFSYTASDGAARSAPIAVTIQVTQGPNTAPTISAIGGQSTLEDNATDPIAFTVGDRETPAANLSVTATSSNLALVPAANILLGGSGASRTLTLTPAPDASGSSTITVTVSDGALSAQRSFVLTVQPQNDAPSITAPSTASTSEDNALVFSASNSNAIRLSDVDAPSDGLLDLTLSLATSGGAPSGTLTLAGLNGLSAPGGGAVANGGSTLVARGTLADLNAALDGLQARPAANFNGGLRLAISLNDRGQSGGAALSANSAIALQVLAVNDAPVALDQSAGTDEDTPLPLTLLARDVDDNSFAFTIVGGPAHGTLARSGSASGPALVYTPGADFVGADSFTFRASDGQATSNLATVSITVGGSNDAPRAVPDSARTNEDTPVNVQVLGNDSDAEGDKLRVVRIATTSATHGAVSINPDGSLRFVPEADFNGEASFSYVVSDGSLESVGQVAIQVLAVNDAPTAQDQSVGTGEDTPLDITLGAQDIDSTGLTFSIVQAPHGGSLSGSGARLRYTPAEDFVGADSFTYKVSDGSLESQTATVSITVGGDNDAPRALPDSARTEEDRPVNIQVLGNDRDPEGDALSLVRVSTSPATHGSVVVNADNTVRYVPEPDFNGAATFSYTVSDGLLQSTALVTVQVRAVNDAPVAQDDAVIMRAGQTVEVQVLANDADADGDALSIASVSSTSPASVSVGEMLGISEDRRSVSFRPAPGFVGTVGLTYILTDGAATTTARVKIQVLAADAPLPPGTPGAPTPGANSVPIGAPDSYSTRGPLQVLAAGGVLKNDRDADGDAITASLNSSPRAGKVSLKADGSFVYTPTATFAGSDSFTYVLSDGKSQSAPITVSLRILASPDVTPPIVLLAGGATRTARSLIAPRGSAADVYVTRQSGIVVSSGLKSVVLQLQRADGQYWNGRVYQRAPFDLRTRQIDRSFFALTDTLPSQSPDGRYLWTAIATDNAGNQSRAGQTFVLDQTPPSLLITTPAADAGNTARLTSLGTISGRASGASGVEVALKRADGLYWNGREYQAEPFFLQAALSNGAWSLSAGLPSGADLPPGRYALIVRARDEVGNAGISSRTIVIASSPAS